MRVSTASPTGRSTQQEASVRVCVIGSGISGLSCAFHLTEHEGVEVTVLERDDVFGGRANTDADGEHCPRIFLDDYHALFDTLRRIPGPDGLSVHAHLRRLRRFSYAHARGWIEVSHLYQVFAKEVPLGQRLRMIRLRPRTPLVAELYPGANANRYGPLRNFSRFALLRMATSLLRSRTAFAFDGPTQHHLVDPWVRHLTGRGVKLRNRTTVTALTPLPDGIAVSYDARSGPGKGTGTERFDAVVVAAFVPDVLPLLRASRLPSAVRPLSHTHCKAFTVELDPAEPALAVTGPAMYCRDGINIVLQSSHQRCLVLVTRAASSADDFVLGKVREYLGLRYPLRSVRVRTNQLAREAVWSATYLRPETMLTQTVPGLFFAGSYLRNSYPVDSGEGAARVALDTCRRVRAAYGLTTAPPSRVG
ncbi:FAD-dependent oxidoreductase [Dactylosporangium sp. NPDC000521]|uniref:FAD-dependent oxidoreductase n=1 Tax=Dactylosporangium sp. NPDC000521 TaxID=3363975 RepID=UPI0036814645